MKESIIMVSAYCDTFEKEQLLRNLINKLQDIRDIFDIMIVSHTIIPNDISKLCDMVFYDKKNELLTDFDYAGLYPGWNWYDFKDGKKIKSYLVTKRTNNQIAIWRMLILGNSIAKNIG